MVFNKSLNEDPRLFTIIHGLLMRRVPFDNPWPADEESSKKKERQATATDGGFWDALPSRQARQATATDGGFLGPSQVDKQSSKTSDSYGWRVP